MSKFGNMIKSFKIKSHLGSTVEYTLPFNTEKIIYKDGEVCEKYFPLGYMVTGESCLFEEILEYCDTSCSRKDGCKGCVSSDWMTYTAILKDGTQVTVKRDLFYKELHRARKAANVRFVVEDRNGFEWTRTYSWKKAMDVYSDLSAKKKYPDMFVKIEIDKYIYLPLAQFKSFSRDYIRSHRFLMW